MYILLSRICFRIFILTLCLTLCFNFLCSTLSFDFVFSFRGCSVLIKKNANLDSGHDFSHTSVDSIDTLEDSLCRRKLLSWTKTVRSLFTIPLFVPLTVSHRKHKLSSLLDNSVNAISLCGSPEKLIRTE